MNYKLITEFPDPMLLKAYEPCISIYLPTHRLVSDKKQDVLVFKNLVKEAKLSLEQLYSIEEIKPLVTLLKLMEDDFELWNYSQAGLAIFATLEDMIIYRIQKELIPIAIVSNSFHIKPLVEYYQAIETFTLLALEAESFALYVGNYLEIQPFTLSEEVKTTLSEVLGNQHTEEYQTHGAYGGASSVSAFHGHGGRSEEVEIDREKYFRFVDRFVTEEISKKIKLPVILVTHKEHQSEFKKLSNNPMMLKECIDGSYGTFKSDEIKEEIKNITDQRFKLIIDQIIENYHNLNNKELSSDQIIIVLKALLDSRVDTLLIEEDKIIPGKIDYEKQQLVKSDLDDPQTDDLLDDMVQLAYLSKSKVFILEKEKMPTESGVAAIFRY